MFVFSLKDGTSLIIDHFEIPALFPASLQAKTAGISKLLMIRLVPSFKLTRSKIFNFKSPSLSQTFQFKKNHMLQLYSWNTCGFLRLLSFWSICKKIRCFAHPNYKLRTQYWISSTAPDTYTKRVTNEKGDK